MFIDIQRVIELRTQKGFFNCSLHMQEYEFLGILTLNAIYYQYIKKAMLI